MPKVNQLGLTKDSCGTLMTIKEFKQDVKSGCLTDYDGFGKYSDGEIEFNKTVDLDSISRSYSHVVWYNR